MTTTKSFSWFKVICIICAIGAARKVSELAFAKLPPLEESLGHTAFILTAAGFFAVRHQYIRRDIPVGIIGFLYVLVTVPLRFAPGISALIGHQIPHDELISTMASLSIFGFGAASIAAFILWLAEATRE